MEFVRIGHTSAAAIESCKTVPALFFGIDTAAAEFICNLRFHNPTVHISHQKCFIPHKLMARVQISPRRHRQIFGSRTTAGQPLGHARPAL